MLFSFVQFQVKNQHFEEKSFPNFISGFLTMSLEPPPHSYRNKEVKL